MSKTLLSRKAIEKLFTYPQKKPIEVDLNLQILSIIRMETSKNEVYTAILSDAEKKYKNFVLKKNENEPEFSNNQIIHLKSLHSTTLKSEKNPVFVVTSYKFIKEETEIIGSPEHIKDEEINRIINNPDILDSIQEERNLLELKETNENSNNIKSNDNEIVKNVKTISYTKPNIQPVSEEINLLRRKVMLVDEKSNTVPCPENAVPLATLNTFTKDFCILIRVIKIGDLKSFTSNRGQGCLFSFLIIDKDGTEMQASCFNKAAERIHNIIASNQVYVIKGGSIKINDRRFNNTKCDFKIVLDDKTVIQKAEDNGEIKLFTVNIVKLSSVININVGSFVDVIGCVVEVNDLIHKTTKNGDVLMRRIFIVDDSLYKLELSLWKTNANLPFKLNDIVLCKNLKVGDFNGKNLATFDDSQIIVNPKGIQEADNLKQLISNYKGEYITFTTTGLKTSVVSQNVNVRYMREVLNSLNKYLNSNTTGEEAPAVLKVTISNFSNTDKNVYAGCPDNNCKKKLTESVQSKGYFCNICNIIYEKPNYYYNISIIVKDCSCEFWVDVFGSLGERLTGISANEYKQTLEDYNEDKMREIQSRIEFKTFIFQVKPKITNFTNQIKKKLQIINIDKVDKSIDSSRILKELELL